MEMSQNQPPFCRGTRPKEIEHLTPEDKAYQTEAVWGFRGYSVCLGNPSSVSLWSLTAFQLARDTPQVENPAQRILHGNTHTHIHIHICVYVYNIFARAKSIFDSATTTTTTINSSQTLAHESCYASVFATLSDGQTKGFYSHFTFEKLKLKPMSQKWQSQKWQSQI